MSKLIHSWGNSSNKYIEAKEDLNINDLVLTYGNLNSYGDAGIPLGKYGYKSTNHKLDPGFYSSSITIEDFVHENNKILYGIPGKSNVTLGGAVASDVHGKDSYWAGNFNNNLESIQIQLSNKDILVCDAKVNSEIFYSTIAGYGLTGSILGIKFKENNTPYSNYFLSQTKKGTGIETLMKCFTEEKDTYTVAWIDLLGNKSNWILETSTIIRPGNNLDKIIQKSNTKELNFSLGFIGNNTFNTMRLINNTYFNLKKENEKIKNFSDIFYPIGFINNSKNIANKRQIVQIQFSLPKKYEIHLVELINLLIYKQKPILCSLKRLSKSSNNFNLSFTQNGWTVAVDFPKKYFNFNSIRHFYKKLIEFEGKIYLAKDSTMNESEFKSMYSNFDKWEKIVKKIDPDNIFQSELSNRLGLKKW